VRDGTAVLSLTQARQRFVFAGVAERPVPSLLRGFSAPVQVRFEHSDADLTHLMTHDSDAFNRWEASQSLAARILMDAAARISSGRAPAYPDSFVKSIEQLLADAARDPAFAAECLQLPAESYIAEQMDVADPTAIHLARLGLMRHIASGSRAQLERAVETFAVAGPYSPDAESIGRRALRNVALMYVASIDDAPARALVLREFDAARNMTDSMAALMCLANSEAPEREDALARFGERWRDEALVMDKWFRVQALSRAGDTLRRVQELSRHAAFDLRNPNRARALLHTLALENPLHFHAADGSGYRWIAEQVVALDRLNPQVASRLARAFDRWKKYGAGRQAHARAALESIRAAEGLSSNVGEVVDRALS
jgi:aminopeptidase N